MAFPFPAAHGLKTGTSLLEPGQVTAAARYLGQAAPGQSEQGPVLGALGHLEHRGSVEGGDADLGAKGRLREADGHLEHEVVPLALVHLVRQSQRTARSGQETMTEHPRGQQRQQGGILRVLETQAA